MDLSSPVRVGLVLVGLMMCGFRDVEVMNRNDFVGPGDLVCGPKYLLRSRGHA